MKAYIKSIFSEKTTNVDPGTSTDLANSLELLSSGIYTEEERFIFELLQNAVDAFSEESELNVKIVAKDGYIIFMHNGEPFSKRDVEGLCSVGNGNKADDIKKIGYKGIGFKSVFMHSDIVTVKSKDVIFEFNKGFDWSTFFNGKTRSDSGREYKMPWQIIPILKDSVPCDLDVSEYNVVPYLKVGNVSSIDKKVERLLSDSQFLLFLRHDNIKIEFISSQNTCHSISKSSCDFKSLGANEGQQKITLYVDDRLESQWLVYKNNLVEIPEELRQEIRVDPKTPQKLQSAESFDISFAIKLDAKGKFEGIDNSVFYTYLPTSCKNYLPFLVNANFITDAGRQQLNVDAIWNQMVIEKMPGLYFNWIATLSKDITNYYVALPGKELGVRSLSDIFQTSYSKAINSIAFIPTLNKRELLKVNEALIDDIGLSKAFSKKRFNLILKDSLGEGFNTGRLVDIKGIDFLKKLGVNIISSDYVGEILEKAEEYFDGFSVNECSKFAQWLYPISQNMNIPQRDLQVIPFLLDENLELTAPEDLFFPSAYRDENSLAADAKVIDENLLELLEQNNLKNWLISLGVQNMSDKSVVKNVLCRKGYINSENAIEVIRFIFDVDCEINIVDDMWPSDMEDVKFLSSKGELKSATSLHLKSDDYQIGIDMPFEINKDIFLSNAYLRETDDPLTWAIFFKKFGINDELKLVSETHEIGSKLFSRFSDYVRFARENEYNYSTWTRCKYYLIPSKIVVKSNPLISLTDKNDYKLSKFVWNNLLQKPAQFEREDDYIFGSTGYGYTKRAYFRDRTYDHNYLGENVLPWALKNNRILPATDGNTYEVTDILENTSENNRIFGKYMPVLDVECNIHSSWREYLPFKKDIELSEYLKVLRKISDDAENIKENEDRISLIYQRICDSFDIYEGNYNYKTVRTWGKSHKILSNDKKFEYAENLNLVSDDLGKIDVEGQVFRGKHIEHRSERFVRFMKALGVTFIDSYTPEFYGETVNDVLQEDISKKAPFICALSVGANVDEESYNSEYPQIDKKIRDVKFIQHDKITLSFGGQKIEKRVFIDKENWTFHYVGVLNIAILELMHIDLARYFNINSSKATLLAILQMNNISEIKDYLEQKGFDLSFIKIETAIETNGQQVVTIGGREYGGLDLERRILANEEARKRVKEILTGEGFEFENGIGTQAVIDGVKKDGVTYPLVVISHRTNNDIQITAAEWMALRKPNSMLWVYFGNGLAKPVNLAELIRRQDKLTLSFETENLANDERMTQFASVLRYFTDLHFDIRSLAPQDVSEKMGKYLFNYNSGRELIQSPDNDSDENL